jgi:hypothetical protein
MKTAFRAALSLNNTAITLMQRSCYRQAFEVLKDAVCLIKMSRQSSFNAAEEEDRVRRMITKAIRYNSNPVVSSDARLPVMEIILHDAPGFVLQGGSVADCHFLIRFDTSDQDLLEDEPLLELPSVVILHNFACLALLTIRHGGKRATCGKQCLDYVVRMLKKLFRASQEDPFRLKRIVYLSTIALNTLIQFQLSFGQTLEARESAAELYYLSQVADRLQGSVLFMGEGLCAPMA